MKPSKCKDCKIKCKHASFWFDRTVSYCPIHEQEEMNEICTGCGKSSCEIDKKKKA